MDGTWFDDLVRALGAPRTRRGALGLLAALAAGGATATAGEARRRCRRDSPAGQCCRKKQGVIGCTCDDGGTVCGPNCCRIGQVCRDGQCVAEPEPGQCIAFGEACKNAGQPCCAGLACGSGQGGEDDVACYVPAGGSCDTTAECVFGARCEMGVCTAIVPPVCVPFGSACVEGADICCAGTCGGTVGYLGTPGREAPERVWKCCVGYHALPDGETCTVRADCCSGNCCVRSGGNSRGVSKVCSATAC